MFVNYNSYMGRKVKPKQVLCIETIKKNSFKKATFEISEIEALILADIEERNQKECAEIMHVSQPTFYRILKRARKKAAFAILSLIKEGKIDVKFIPPKECREWCDNCKEVRE